MTRQYCRDQLLRLSGLPGYPRTDEGKGSLIDALAGAFLFSGEAALRRWIDDVLRSATHCPLPRDAYRAGYERRPAAQTPSGYHCTICYDTGETVGAFLVTWREGHRYSQRLTPEQAEQLLIKHRAAQARNDRAGMLEVGTQMIYEGPIACECKRPTSLPLAPPERPRAGREL